LELGLMSKRDGSFSASRQQQYTNRYSIIFAINPNCLPYSGYKRLTFAAALE